MKKIFIIALGLAPLLATGSMAEDTNIAALREARLKQQTVQRFDKNGDGQTGKKEAAAAKTHHGKVVTNFDKNKDGALGKKERGAATASQGKGKSPAKTAGSKKR